MNKRGNLAYILIIVALALVVLILVFTLIIKSRSSSENDGGMNETQEDVSLKILTLCREARVEPTSCVYNGGQGKITLSGNVKTEGLRGAVGLIEDSSLNIKSVQEEGPFAIDQSIDFVFDDLSGLGSGFVGKIVPIVEYGGETRVCNTPSEKVGCTGGV